MWLNHYYFESYTPHILFYSFAACHGHYNNCHLLCKAVLLIVMLVDRIVTPQSPLAPNCKACNLGDASLSMAANWARSQ